MCWLRSCSSSQRTPSGSRQLLPWPPAPRVSPNLCSQLQIPARVTPHDLGQVSLEVELPYGEAKPHREEIAGFGAFILHHPSSDVQPTFKLFYYSWEEIWTWRSSCRIGFSWSFLINVLAARCCPDLWLGAPQQSQTQIPNFGGPKPFAPSCPRAKPCQQGTVTQPEPCRSRVRCCSYFVLREEFSLPGSPETLAHNKFP